MPKIKHSETDAYIGQRIRQARIAAKLSQTDLGKAVNVSFQQIQKIESGDNRVSASQLVRIAECLDLPITYFLPSKSKKEREVNDTFADFLTSKDGQRLADSFMQITDPVKRRVLINTAEVLASKQ